MWRLQGADLEKIYLSLGSNLGDKFKNLNRAITFLKTDPDVKNVTVSSFYKTAPQGYTDQDSFLNCVVGLESSLPPNILLKLCQTIESKLKRVRLFRWGPRTIDVDILLYGTQIIDTVNLTVPHPRMFERAFVLIPLDELTHEYRSYLDKLEDQNVIKV